MTDALSQKQGKLNFQQQKAFFLAIMAMCIIIAVSNVLVQYPVQIQIGQLSLADILTYGTFTYPVTFLISDITNRLFGPRKARRVVITGFALAVILSILLASPRIAVASGCAFLLSQLLDISIFDYLRNKVWWLSPLTSSFIGSFVDNTIFYALAFAVSFNFLGANIDFAQELAPGLGVMTAEFPRWISWAMGDLLVKLLIAILMLPLYRLIYDYVMRTKQNYQATQ